MSISQTTHQDFPLNSLTVSHDLVRKVSAVTIHFQLHFCQQKLIGFFHGPRANCPPNFMKIG